MDQVAFYTGRVLDALVVALWGESMRRWFYKQSFSWKQW